MSTEPNMGRARSVFQEWKTRIRGIRRDGNDGYCALGWLDRMSIHGQQRQNLVRRIATHIRKHFAPVYDPFNFRGHNGKLGEDWDCSDEQVIAAANNMYDEMTPQKFAEIDVLTQDIPASTTDAPRLDTRPA